VRGSTPSGGGTEIRRRVVKVGSVILGGSKPLALIAGPCVIESRHGCLALARRLATLAAEERIPLIFKASYDKANRSSYGSWRGPGLERGLEILRAVRDTTGLPVLTDVHSPAEAAAAGAVVDVVQVPAFLCRQTDLLTAAGETGKPVNVKKGQFMAPWDMCHVLAKLERTGNRNLIVTERGATFGYNNLVADMRSLLVLREFGYPVVFDATHSVQRPGSAGDCSGGDAQWAPGLARGAVAVGCDAVFMETHVAPQRARSDAANAVPLRALRRVWRVLRSVDEVVD
jgi:2-dehydro-3-deoxyphosphooctonate aldolase (KDO 8-P synthase)